MLFVDNIIKIVRLGIASSYLKNEKSYLNIILLSDPEAGKSSMLLHFNYDKIKNAFVFSDLTKSKLEKFFKEASNPQHAIKYIVIPDFTRLVSHSKDTQKGLIGMMNSGIEEGLRELTMYYGGSMHETKTLDKPLKFGIATSATRKFISDRRRTGYWFSIGFMSRLLPVSFKYSKEHIRKIRDYLAGSRDIMQETETLRLKHKSITCPSKHVRAFDSQIDSLAEASMLYGFRYTRQFRIMLKANALLRGSNKVTKRDVNEIKKLSKWINLDYNEVE